MHANQTTQLSEVTLSRRDERAIKKHFCRGMTDDQLKAAFLLHFNNRPVSAYEIRMVRNSDNDMFFIVNEMIGRQLFIMRPDFGQAVYVLKEDLHASS
jgi:hypothetical protein